MQITTDVSKTPPMRTNLNCISNDAPLTLTPDWLPQRRVLSIIRLVLPPPIERARL